MQKCTGMQCVSPIAESFFFKEYLDAAGIENYIPMRYEYVVRKERRLRKLVPAVHNLVFVRSTRERMDEIKNEPGMNIPIRYIMDRETRQPIVIPDSQMRSSSPCLAPTTRPCSILNPPS